MPAAAADVSLAPAAGYQLLTHTSDGISHGPLREQIFLGRSVVGGAGLDVGFGGHHHVRLEAQVGPYHGDFDRFCIERITTVGIFCDEDSLRDTRYALLAGADYTYVSRTDGVSPVLGAGVGFKRYSLEDPDVTVPTTRLFLSAIAGVEIPSRAPVRLEARLLYLPEHPFLEGARDAAKMELHVSVSVRIPLSGR
jgi:hypothetical protein